MQEIQKTLMILKQENCNLKLKIFEAVERSFNSSEETKSIMFNHQYLRRRVKHEIQEMWNYLKFGLLNSMAKFNEPISREYLQEMLTYLKEEHAYLMGNMMKLADSGIAWWRKKGLDSLSEEILAKIEKLQNPKNCSSQPKLYCHTEDRTCGFGCVAHLVVLCLLSAYSTNRILILHPKLKDYSNSSWTDNLLLPSSKCLYSEVIKGERMPEDSAFMVLGSNYFYLQAIPIHLEKRISHYHNYPFVWFISQFVRYIMRPTKSLQIELDKQIQKMYANKSDEFHQPIVGIHVRRTDKVEREAQLHDLSEYMERVEDWFQQQESLQIITTMNQFSNEIKNYKPLKRRVFLASDDPNIFTEAKSRYPQYTFYSNELSISIAKTQGRNTAAGLKSIVMDILLLSHMDYIVCTFSSNVCRVSYELMQTRHSHLGDASNRYFSLDDIYYFDGQGKFNLQATYPHQTPPYPTILSNKWNEINLTLGQLIGTEGNHWNGFSVKSGNKYPSYKVKIKNVVY